MRSLSKQNITPNFWCFNFRFVWFSGWLQKNFLKKLKKRIYRNKGHFRSLHMLLDLCRKNEGNPFSTKIGVVGSYTDTLLNFVLIVSALLLMLKLFFKTPGASDLSSHTRTDSTDHNYPKSFTKLVAGGATVFTLGKRREDLTTGKRNISRPFWNMITPLQLLITWKQLVTTSNGTSLTFWHPARLTTIVKLKRPCLFKSCSQHWMPMPAVKSFYPIKKAFSLSLYRQFPFRKRLKLLLQMFSV